MVLGLVRQLAIACTGMIQAYRHAGDNSIDWFNLLKNTLVWLLPFGHLQRNNRWFYSLTSFLFHIGTIIVPLFLYAHVHLWRRATGIGWPTLPGSLADGLSFLVLVTGIGLIVGRIARSQSRSLTRPQDLLLPPLIVVIFVSGFLAAHPTLNLFSYQGAMVVHVISGDLLLLLVPFSKLAHVALWPFTHIATELAWRFPPDAGSKVIETMGKEDRV